MYKPKEEYIKISEYIRVHQISYSTARRWIKARKVDSIKRGGTWYIKSAKKLNPLYGRTKLQLIDENLALKKEVQRLQKLVRDMYQKLVFGD